MGGGAALVLGQSRLVGNILFRHQPVVRRQSSAAILEGHHRWRHARAASEARDPQGSRRGGVAFRAEWPLARTRWTKFYFDLSKPAAGTGPNTGRLVDANPAVSSSRSYPATSLGSMGSTSAASSQVMGGGIPPGMGIALETPPLAHDLEVTGPVA